VFRVYSEAGNVIEARKHKGDFKECQASREKQKAATLWKRDGPL